MKPIILITILIIFLLAVCVVTFLFTPVRKNITKKYEVALLLVAVSVLLEFCVSPLRGYVGMATDAIVGFFVFLFGTWYFLKRFGQYIGGYQTTAYIILGQLLLTGLFHALYFKETLISFPDFLMHVLG